jgi:hypothetical protein
VYLDLAEFDENAKVAVETVATALGCETMRTDGLVALCDNVSAEAAALTLTHPNAAISPSAAEAQTLPARIARS